MPSLCTGIRYRHGIEMEHLCWRVDSSWTVHASTILRPFTRARTILRYISEYSQIVEKKLVTDGIEPWSGLFVAKRFSMWDLLVAVSNSIDWALDLCAPSSVGQLKRIWVFYTYCFLVWRPRFLCCSSAPLGSSACMDFFDATVEGFFEPEFELRFPLAIAQSGAVGD